VTSLATFSGPVSFLASLTFASGLHKGGNAFRSGTQGISANTDTTLTFTSSDQDDLGFWSAGSNPSRLTALRADWYHADGWVQWNGYGTTGVRFCHLAQNGVNITQTEFAASAMARVHVGATVYCSAGDYFQLIVYQTGASTAILYSRLMIAY